MPRGKKCFEESVEFISWYQTFYNTEAWHVQHCYISYKGYILESTVHARLQEIGYPCQTNVSQINLSWNGDNVFLSSSYDLCVIMAMCWAFGLFMICPTPICHMHIICPPPDIRSIWLLMICPPHNIRSIWLDMPPISDPSDISWYAHPTISDPSDFSWYAHPLISDPSDLCSWVWRGLCWCHCLG